MPDNGKPGRTVNRSDLATLCGVSLPTIDAWVRRGCPIIGRGSKGKPSQFDSAAVIRWIKADAVATATEGLVDADGKMSKDEADRRRAVANMVSAEVAADEDLKSVMSRFDVETSFADFCQALRSSLATTGAKIANRTATMNNPAEIRSFCQDVINKAFDAAEADLREGWSNDLREDEDDIGED